MKETPLLTKCITDDNTFIIPTKNIISIKPIISQDGDAYDKVNYYDDELCVINTIYCSEIEMYEIN